MSTPEDRKSFSWTITGAKNRQSSSLLNPQSFPTTNIQKSSSIEEDGFGANEMGPKSQKFGNFMGKLLLKSRVNNNKQFKKTTIIKPSKENLKQTTLTEEPYIGLFRVRKTRLEQQKSTALSLSSNKIRFSLKLKNNESSTNEEKCNKNKVISGNLSFQKYHLINGRQTRWDVNDNGEVCKSYLVEPSENAMRLLHQEKHHHANNNEGSKSFNLHETCTQEHKDDSSVVCNIDDESDLDSIVSLQSDDDVLGPWIELGMVDTNLISKQEKSTQSDKRDCEVCISNSSHKDKDREPFEIINVCESCQPKWNTILEETFKNYKKDQKSQKNTTKQNQKHSKKMKLSHEKSKTVVANVIDKRKLSTNISSKKASNMVPPTTSRYQQRANKKMMADKKNSNFTIVENSNVAKSSVKESKAKNHITTGAFMTRKTAQELADPEHGFYPNPYGFYHKQHVQVLNLNGRWYHGTLENMNKGRVKVKYDDWDDQEEWIIMGSRRLKSLSPDQERSVSEAEKQTTTEIIDITTIERDDAAKPSAAVNTSNNHTVDTVDLTTFCEPSTSGSSLTNNKKLQSDYVSDMLDKDPTQIFNNNEVFMTRKMARELVDEYGFKPNSFGYRRNRAVAIVFHAKRKGERKIKSECIAFLREMRLDQIRVWYPDLHISEWLPVGSRRLRVLSDEEESNILSKNEIDLSIQEVPVSTKHFDTSPNRKHQHKKASETASEGTASSSKQSTRQAKAVKGKSRKIIGKGPNVSSTPSPPENSVNNLMKTVSDPYLSSTSCSQEGGRADLDPDENKSVQEEFADTYLTTGAFATRRAMRQLKDSHGFTPNPYGYTYSLAVEILNIRSGKSKFWERGTLVAMRPGQVKVHYDGWADVYDEWIMVGSRRIRITSKESELNQGEKQDDLVSDIGKECVQDNNSADLFTNELLLAEMNPEIREEAKNNRKHSVVSAQDYQKLGLLISIEEIAAKEMKKTERRENLRKLKLLSEKEKSTKNKEAKSDSIVLNEADDESDSDKEESDHDEYTANEVKYRRKKHDKKKKKQRHISKKTSTSKNIQYHQKECHHNCNLDDTASSSNEKKIQTISLRLAQAEASNKKEFIANVYGYDYMQHVTVLHLDKKMYEGRLIRMSQNKVKVHYCGWLDAFDEEIPLGSRRIQPIENDHEVECLEPTFRERYEQLVQNELLHGCSACADSQQQQQQQQNAKHNTVNKINRKRLTLDDVYSDDDSENRDIEYHKETVDEDEQMVESQNWKVYCNQCNVVIKQFRYYCTYCETPSQGYDYQSFELCLRCFDQNFPFWHEHPRSSFAIQSVIDTEMGPRPIKGELVTVWEEDILEDSNLTNYEELNSNKDELCEIVSSLNITDQPTMAQESSTETSLQLSVAISENTSLEASKIFPGKEAIGVNQGYKYLKKWKKRKVCAFCNDDDDTSEELGQFIGPFVIATFNKNGVEKKRSFWAHDSCARYSPEVFCTPEGKWYNVTLALRRGRGMRCHVCKEKGATIGCFESKCSKSFHLPCSQKPVTYFKNGVIFWCSAHEAYYNKIDTYVNIFNCDGCDKQLADESWFTCVPCSSSYFKSFDLCTECYEKFPTDHDHNEDEFEETSFAILKEMEAQKATEVAKEKEEQDTKKKKKPLFPRRRRKLADGTLPVSCCYCGTYESGEWRKGYEGGVIMCSKCFELALLIDNDGKHSDMPLVIDNYMDNQNQDQNLYAAAIEDYSHKPYLTRDALSLSKFSESLTGSRLASYEPQQNQLFSLSFDSTYFDIPGRAPRWATHSGTDYHGTWLPQTVRRAILKHTSKDERVLSNFLGRGTDAIECFLLQRRCCGIDINPAAVALSQRNCCFEIPPGLTSAEYRPIIAQADSRQLSGALFTDDSYHHILSHPPYKDCVAYSTHLEGDLSRFTNVDDFKIEYTKVVKESYRLLKMCRRLTLGIGDNREHCFYIPVGFHLIRLYIDHGFELEELVIKRQRYCSAFGLGTYLCVQFDFLVFTHEFIATFKKVPLEVADKMHINESDSDSGIFRFNKVRRGIPSSAIMRKSVVMGTVWVFKPTEKYKFEQLCTSRMVERFGRDDSNWEHVYLVLSDEETSASDETETDFTDTNIRNENDSSNTLEECPSSEDISEYERERLKRIEENNKTLLQLGLISELSEESEDIVHYEMMLNKEAYPQGDLGLIVIGHIPNLQPNQINSFRKSMIKLAQDAIVNLATKGFLIIGTQDIRDPMTGKLWPLTMLVLEDIEREVGRELIKLKEMVVAVPEGYSKDRKKVFTSEEPNQDNEEIIDIETISNDHLPIVHAIYLIFQKL